MGGGLCGVFFRRGRRDEDRHLVGPVCSLSTLLYRGARVGSVHWLIPGDYHRCGFTLAAAACIPTNFRGGTSSAYLGAGKMLACIHVYGQSLLWGASQPRVISSIRRGEVIVRLAHKLSCGYLWSCYVFIGVEDMDVGLC